VDKVIPHDLANEWMRRDMAFSVSPRPLLAFAALAASFGQSLPVGMDPVSTEAINTTIDEVFRAWKCFANGEVREHTEWLYVKSSVTSAQWSHAKSASLLLTSAFNHSPTSSSFPPSSQAPPPPPPPCFLNANWMRKYTTRTGPDSLFHTLMRNAEHIGHHDIQSNHIHWHTFQPVSHADPLCVALRELRKEPVLWSLMSKSCSQGQEVCHPWLFALCQTSQRMAARPSTNNKLRRGAVVFDHRELYSHLLFFQKLRYWTPIPRNILEDVQNQPILNQIIRQYAYVHRMVYKKALDLPGPHPGKFLRQVLTATPFVSLAPSTASAPKRVVAEDETQLIRMYGLSMHHLEDMSIALGHSCM